MKARVGRRSLLVATLWLATAAAAPPTPSPLPAADFARLPFMQDPVIAPGGRAVAARVAVEGEQMLVVVPLDGRKPVLGRSGRLDMNWFAWLNDDWLVAGVESTSRVDGQEWVLTRLMRVRADLTDVSLVGERETAQFGDDLVWLAPDGTPRLLLARQTSTYLNEVGFFPEVISVDVLSGKTSRVVPSRRDIWNWAADGSGTVRAGWGSSESGRKRSLVYRPAETVPFREVDSADTREGETLLVPVLFPAEGPALAIIDDEQGFAALYEVDMETRGRGRQLFGKPGFDIEGIITDPARSRLLGVLYTDTSPRIHWIDQDLASLQAMIDGAVPPGKRARVLSWSRDRLRYLVHVGSASEPGRFWVLDRVAGSMKPFAWVNEAIKAPLHPVTTLRYKARDGLEIQAVLTVPAGKPTKDLPLIMMPHGGPWARDDESWDWWAQFLADRGYAVVQPNYRGSSGFGTPFEEAGYGEMGLKMQDDLNDAIAHLAREGVADPKRVCIVGGSYGGYAAMRAAHRDAALYRCAVSFAGVSDLEALRRYDRRFLGGGYVTDRFKAQAPDLKAVSPLTHASEVAIPVLLVHGKADKRVPVFQSRLFHERLKQAGKDVTYIEQPLGDHHLTREADRLQFLEAMESFLTRHNPA